MADKLVDDLKRALGDAYTIERELTGGGMSRVFVAKEHALGREVVIKVLPPDLAAGVNRDRFRREVQLAARLSHPYIVPLLHAGEHEELLWFTMPYIPGESLRTRLLRTGPLKLPEVVKLLHDVVEALAYAHSRGVIHRDIKPGNILYDGSHAVVTDFGVAKALNAALPNARPRSHHLRHGDRHAGLHGARTTRRRPDADQRVDIYAVGLLAYELLSGASPFAAAVADGDDDGTAHPDSGTAARAAIGCATGFFGAGAALPGEVAGRPAQGCAGGARRARPHLRRTRRRRASRRAQSRAGSPACIIAATRSGDLWRTGAGRRRILVVTAQRCQAPGAGRQQQCRASGQRHRRSHRVVAEQGDDPRGFAAAARGAADPAQAG